MIVASLVEPRPGDGAGYRTARARSRWPAYRRPAADGVDAALVGQRVQAEGRVAPGAMQVSRARADDLSDLSGASRLSIEAYVRRAGGNLQFGSGFVVRDTPLRSLGNAPVVVNAVSMARRPAR